MDCLYQLRLRLSHDIVYNGSKSRVLICSPNKTVTDPVFCIQNNLIERKTKAKYLGHIISKDMSDIYTLSTATEYVINVLTY